MAYRVDRFWKVYEILTFDVKSDIKRSRNVFIAKQIIGIASGDQNPSRKIKY